MVTKRGKPLGAKRLAKRLVKKNKRFDRLVKLNRRRTAEGIEVVDAEVGTTIVVPPHTRPGVAPLRRRAV